MEPLHFIIAILGCGEGDASCQPVRTLDTRYESKAACTAATEAAAAGNSDVDFPVIVAQCVPGSAAAKPLKADQVKLPGGGKAQVRVSPIRS